MSSYLALEDPFAELKFAGILPSGLYLFVRINCPGNFLACSPSTLPPGHCLQGHPLPSSPLGAVVTGKLKPSSAHTHLAINNGTSFSPELSRIFLW